MLTKLIQWIVKKYYQLFSKCADASSQSGQLNVKKGKCPIPEPHYLLESADCLGRRVREKRASAWKMMVEYVLNSKTVDHEMYLVEEEGYNAGLLEAKTVDLNISLMPPVCVKQIADNHKFWGLPFSSSRKDLDCIRTGQSVGGLFLSLARTYDISYDPSDCERNANAPRNPYDYTRSSGGGCNGAAALVSSCGVAFAIGASERLSICVSSAYCGIFSHQFSADVFSFLETHKTDGEATKIVSFGPLVRYAADLKILFRGMPFKSPLFKSLKVHEEVKVEELNYYFLSPLVLCPWSKDVSERILELVHFLSEQTKGRVFGLKMQVGSGPTLSTIPAEEVVRPDKLTRKLEAQFLSDAAHLHTKTKCFVKNYRFTYILSKAKDVVSTLLLIKKNKNREEEIRNFLADFRDQVSEILNVNGVLILPINNNSAPKLHQPGNIGDVILSALFEGLPSTAIPIGLDKLNLPIGIQVIGAPLQDRLCIAVAESLEVPFGGWLAPFTKN